MDKVVYKDEDTSCVDWYIVTDISEECTLFFHCIAVEEEPADGGSMRLQNISSCLLVNMGNIPEDMELCHHCCEKLTFCIGKGDCDWTLFI